MEAPAPATLFPPPPSLWCISYEQLLDIDKLALETFGPVDYTTTVTMRDICKRIIEPRCQATGTSYALSLNRNGLPIDSFVTHSWDGCFASFVQSIQNVFQTWVQKPNLWICAFSLNQGNAEMAHQQVGLSNEPLEQSPFVQALYSAKSFCVVRNANTDLYSRIWCVCELMYAVKQGLFPHQTHVTGPDEFSQLQTSCLDAQATELTDRDRILKALLNEHNREQIDQVVQLFRAQDTPQQFCIVGGEEKNGNAPPVNQQKSIHVELEHLKSILHPLCHLDDDLIEEHMSHFQEGTREWAIKSFDNWLQKDDNKHRVFVLTAQAGIGKTGIVCKIARDRGQHILAYHFCRHDDTRRSNPHHMLLSFAYQMARQLPDYRAQLEEMITSHDLNRSTLLKDYNLVGLFDELIRVPLSKVKVVPDLRSYVILIDALDECEQQGKNEMLLCIQRHFIKLPSWIQVYVTTRPEIPVIEKLKKFSPTFIEPDMEDNRKDLRIYFRLLLEELEGSSDEVVEMLVDKTGGLFIYAAHLANMIREEHANNGTSVISLQNLEAFPTGLDEFYEKQFDRILIDDSECLEWRIVELAIAAREPLHVEMIQSLLHCTRKERVAALHQLSSFFVLDANRKLHIYHKSFTDWVTDPEREDSEFFVHAPDIEPILAKHCLEVLNESGIVRDCGQTKGTKTRYHPEVIAYALTHGVYHLCACDRIAEARKLVLNVGWLVERAQAGACNDILSDYKKIKLSILSDDDQDIVVDLVGRSLGLSLGALRVDPRQLPGQLVGRLLSSTKYQASMGRLRSSTPHPDTKEDEQRQELSNFVHDLQNFDYGFQWWCPVVPTWDQAERPCSRVMEGHEHIICSVACSRDGTGRIASGSNDKTVRLWDSQSGKCELILRGHTECVNAVAWSTDSSHVASASSDKTIRVWDATTGECVQNLAENKYAAFSVAMSEDLKVVSGHLETIKVWDMETGNVEKILHEHTQTVRSLSLFQGGPRLASGSDDKTIRLWDIDTGACLGVLTGHTGSVNSVVWASDGRVVSGSFDKTVKVWDGTKQVLLQSSENHTNAIQGVAWAPDLKKVAVGSTNAEAWIYSTEVGQFEKQLGWHNGYRVTVDWSPDGTVVSGAEDMSVRVWDPGMHQPLFGIPHHCNYVKCRAWSWDGSMVASGSDDRTVRIWEASTGECLHLLEGHSHNVSCVSFSKNDEWLTSSSWDKTVRIWNVVTGKSKAALVGHKAGVTVVKWSENDEHIASTSIDLSIRIWCFASGTCTHVLSEGLIRDPRPRVPGQYTHVMNDGVETRVKALLWSADNKLLFAGTGSGSIRLWDTSMNGPKYSDGSKCDGVLVGHTSYVHSLACSKDGRKLVSGSEDHTVRAWNLSTRIFTDKPKLPPPEREESSSYLCEHILQGHAHGVTEVVLSEGGIRILSRCIEEIRIWDSEQGACLQVIRDTAPVPRDFHPANTSVIIRDFSTMSPAGEPVGVASRNVMVFGHRACARLDMTKISFFELKG